MHILHGPSRPEGNTVRCKSVFGVETGIASVASTSHRNLKLPQTVLLSFIGKVEEWLLFKDTFRKMIHNHEDPSSVEKLQYLKSVLRNDASRKINVFSVTK